MKTIQLGTRAVGAGAPCYVIAEIGANHNRDLDTARRLIDVAAETGCDAAKFQTYTGAGLYSAATPRFDYLGELGDVPIAKLLDDIALPREWQPILADHCRDVGIEFLSSPFDLEAVAELDQLGVAAFKIASFEMTDLPFLDAVASCGRPIILSTGMATLGEVDESVQRCINGGAPAVCILQCASLYPSPPHIMNLRAIPTMAAALGWPVGLSDHTLGIHVPTASIALGCAAIEKHITLDRAQRGPDHAFAIEPDELRDMVQHIRDVEAALGDGVKAGPSPEEAAEMFSKARRSVVSAVDIPAGTVVTREMLTTKRPGVGIPPKMLEAVVGRVARVDVPADTPLTWEML